MLKGTLGATGVRLGVAGRMICAPIFVASGPAAARPGIGGVGPNGCSSSCTRPTNSWASALAIAAARSGELSVTAADRMTVSGSTLTAILSASCGGGEAQLQLPITGSVIRSSVSSGAYETTRSLASWLAWYAASELSAWPCIVTYSVTLEEY